MFHPIMLRRILACLALITGLAALGTPAEARMSVVQAQSIVDGAQSPASGTVAPCPVAQPAQGIKGKVAVKAPCRPPKPMIIYIPTIQFGPDRALE